MIVLDKQQANTMSIIHRLQMLALAFPYDNIHLVCPGVMRRLLDLWIGTTGPFRCHVSSGQAPMVSDGLLVLRNYVPSEFS